MSEQYNEKVLYRSRNGILSGVCAGLAKYFEFSVSGVRIVTVLLTIFTGIWPALLAYLIAALVIKPEPVVPFNSFSDREFYDSYTHSSRLAVMRLKDTFEKLERRIRRMEDIVTDREFEWKKKLNS